DWSEDIPHGERQEIAADILRGHIVEPHQDQTIGKEDGIVEKGLSQHENKTENGATAMFVHEGVPNLAPRCVGAGAHTRWRRGGTCGIGVMECWSNGGLFFPILHYSITPFPLRAFRAD